MYQISWVKISFLYRCRPLHQPLLPFFQKGNRRKLNLFKFKGWLAKRSPSYPLYIYLKSLLKVESNKIRETLIVAQTTKSFQKESIQHLMKPPLHYGNFFLEKAIINFSPDAFSISKTFLTMFFMTSAILINQSKFIKRNTHKVYVDPRPCREPKFSAFADIFKQCEELVGKWVHTELFGAGTKLVDKEFRCSLAFSAGNLGIQLTDSINPECRIRRSKMTGYSFDYQY